MEIETENQLMNNFESELPNKQRFTTSEAAIYLGVARSTIYKMIDTEEIRVLRVGKLYKVPRQSILDAMKEYDPYE